MLLGYFDEYEYVQDFDLKAEEIPKGFIIQREIKKAIDGKDFFYQDGKTLEKVACQGVSFQDFLYYYRIWEDFHYFGLPHGRGSVNERRWVLDIIKIFEKANQSVQVFIEDRMSKKGNMT